MSSTFKQSSTSAIISGGFTFDVYPWSTAANWIGAVPGNGAAATFNVVGGGNPSGYDDIANLFLDSLTLTSGFVAVGGAADLSHGASLEIGTVSFGSTTASVYSDTNLGSPSATLLIDGFSNTGTYGRIAATGANAFTEIRSATDPGEIYQVDGGGELVLDPTPLANAGTTQAGFYYQNSGSPSGTFAFRNPGTTINLPLASVAIGDSIALPGSVVSSVTYGANSIAVVTNQGTVDFTDVSYSGTHPTGFVIAPDAVSGLERITFTSQQSTSFQQTTTSSVVSNGFTFGVYLWSTAANWTNGVPGNGAAVTTNITGGGNPSGYDDIANLFLDSLTLTSGFVAAGGAADLSHGASLEIGTVRFGSTTASVYSDTNLGSPSATLLIDGFSNTGTYGRIAATGANAFTEIRSATDPGEIYQVDGGGELVLDPTPLANAGTTQAGFYYQNSGSPSGTFAFRNPGTTINLPLASVAIGDSIALPGSVVSSVSYGPSSITVVTNLGTTTFANVSYASNEVFTGFTRTTDALTGLQKITFGGYPTTSFQQTITTDIISNGFTFGVYLWSTAANWTNGVPGNGAGVTQNIAGGGNPSGYDDISNLFLNTANLVSGFVAVGGSANLAQGASLEIGTVSFSSTTASIYSDTNLGSPSATLLIDGFSNTGTYGRIAATGAHALTVVQSATDSGEIYQVDGGGELVLTPTPLANAGTTQAGFYYQNSGSPSGTFAFSNPWSTIALPLASVAIGDSIALPGTSVSSVTYGANSITVVSNQGTTVFSDVSYSGTTPGGFIASADPTGLERVTFTLCFCRGTLIRTPAGDVPVETLSIGDMVVTAAGAIRPVTWIGTGQVLATRGRRNAVTPVIIRKNALADNVPHCDLRVTKGHSLYLEGVLIPVEFLVNHRSILWDDRAQEVAIYHVELETHDVLIANGAPAESYRDDGNRWLFRNTNRRWAAAPQEPCAPLLTGGELVDRIWRQLLDRAGPRPRMPMTQEPGLHLVADGMRLDPMDCGPDVCVFHLPKPPRSVRLVSLSAVPQELGVARDARELGGAVQRFVLEQGGYSQVLLADDRRLIDGYHAFEPDIGIRWTTGDAVIPSALFKGMAGTGLLRVHLGCSTVYADIEAGCRAA